MLKLLRGIAVCTIVGLSQAPVLAASGTALGVDPAAEARKANEVRQLVVGADISIGERIVTGPSGQVQIKFDDETELVVGPSSSLVIEDYLLRGNGSAGKLAINALAGTFRFVTGNSPKDRYSIKTPTGTIGVRGTAFELYVTKLWSYILMQHGSTISCNEQNECIVLEAQCEVGQFSGGEAIVVGEANKLSREDRAKLKQLFMYAGNQSPLLEEFRINQAELCLKPRTPQAGGSLLDPGEPVPPPPPVINGPDEPDIPEGCFPDPESEDGFFCL